MLLLGHAAVSARRGPRGTCQETRAALWAPAECGVTARSASDGVDVNGIRVHHRRLQYRKYQCGMFWKLSPARVLCYRCRGGVRFLDRSLNLIGKIVRPERWLRPPHIRARQSRAAKFASASRTCLRTVHGVRICRPRIGVASRRIPQGERYFSARIAQQIIAHARGRAGRQHRFGAGHIDLPAHSQIRKLFSKKCLHSSQNIGYYLPR